MSVINDAIGGILAPVKDIVSEVVVDKDKRDQINLQLQQLADQAEARIHDETMAQIGVNNTEAQSKALFIAGWRPFIGWTGGVGLSWSFVVSPFAEWISRLFGWKGDMPHVDSSQLMTLVLAMLGIGGYRTYEKIKGVSSDTLSAPAVNTAAPAKDRESQGILDELHRSTAETIPEKAPWAR